MGVINITPNSFSDGHLYNSIESFSHKFSKLLTWADLIDIGAESTAPFNEKVDQHTELQRFQNIFFPYLEQNKDPNITLSIDTYKVDVFRAVAKKVKDHWPKTKLLFNDVSGVIDEELLSLLKEDSEFQYVLSHNLAPTREYVSSHMDFAQEECELISSMSQFYAQNLLALNEFKSRIIIDPCFGFSKTRNQNIELMKNINHFIDIIPSQMQILIGVSRKSFLRSDPCLDAKDSENQTRLDHIQTLFFHSFSHRLKERDFIFRVHEKHSFVAIVDYLQIMESLK